MPSLYQANGRMVSSPTSFPRAIRRSNRTLSKQPWQPSLRAQTTVSNLFPEVAILSGYASILAKAVGPIWAERKATELKIQNVRSDLLIAVS
ncbi:unnamed protein product [Rotaria sordida]|uniref:Uncharacterized protein n=1 Tax=Rotaria sordida TaxID=392033 RepID=A0A815GVK0_9BILA|nr:unnamed protein product [Rotaria sordida]